MTVGSMIPSIVHDPVENLLSGWNVHPWLVSVFSMVIPNILYFTISMASFVFGVNLVFGFLEEIGFLALAATMSQAISKPEALAFLFACTFNVPCVMALTTTFRESHSLKWTARVAAFYIGGALVLACIVFHISALFL